MLLPVPSNACSGTAVVNMSDTRVEMEDAILNMGQPDALSPPKAEKALQLLHRRSSAKDREKSPDNMAASNLLTLMRCTAQ
jgi:hypothetical protein